jgi:hypothetical protein
MKHYRYTEYGGKWDHKEKYPGKYKKKTATYHKKTTYPWKNEQKSFRST